VVTRHRCGNAIILLAAFQIVNHRETINTVPVSLRAYSTLTLLPPPSRGFEMLAVERASNQLVALRRH
jgi:hypothetical protein